MRSMPILKGKRQSILHVSKEKTITNIPRMIKQFKMQTRGKKKGAKTGPSPICFMLCLNPIVLKCNEECWSKYNIIHFRVDVMFFFMYVSF